jgi:hypothetical protein
MILGMLLSIEKEVVLVSNRRWKPNSQKKPFENVHRFNFLVVINFSKLCCNTK